MTMTSSVIQVAHKLNNRLRLYTPTIEEHAFIIGAMKSGTTTLYEYLIQHPEIARNRFQKEPEFFSRNYDPNDLAHYKRQYFPLPSGRCVALDASTGYSKQPKFPGVPERLSALEAQKYFIYILRNPIDRIESHVAHNLASRHLLLEDGERPDFGHFLAVSNYAAQLNAYAAQFPDFTVKIVLFDHLKENAIDVVRDVASHLDLSPDFEWKTLPPQNVRRAEHGSERFRLSNDERIVLKRLLEPDMRQLASKYGVDIARWGFS